MHRLLVVFLSSTLSLWAIQEDRNPLAPTLQVEKEITQILGEPMCQKPAQNLENVLVEDEFDITEYLMQSFMEEQPSKKLSDYASIKVKNLVVGLRDFGTLLEIMPLLDKQSLQSLRVSGAGKIVYADSLIHFLEKIPLQKLYLDCPTYFFGEKEYQRLAKAIKQNKTLTSVNILSISNVDQLKKLQPISHVITRIELWVPTNFDIKGQFLPFLDKMPHTKVAVRLYGKQNTSLINTFKKIKNLDTIAMILCPWDMSALLYTPEEYEKLWRKKYEGMEKQPKEHHDLLKMGFSYSEAPYIELTEGGNPFWTIYCKDPNTYYKTREPHNPFQFFQGGELRLEVL